MEDNLCSKIKDLVEESQNLTSTWQSNAEKFHKMRMRIKKEKSFPFVGCSNIRMPTIEIKLRKVKAALANVIFGIRPICQVIPQPTGNWASAVKIEKFLDHLIMDCMDFKRKALIGIDQSLEKGFFIFKPFWRTDIITRVIEFDLDELPIEEAMFMFNASDEEIIAAIQKKYDIDMSEWVNKDNTNSLKSVVDAFHSGKKQFKIDFQDVIYNYPDVSLCQPERVYVPTDSGVDPQDCSWLVHEFLLDIATVKTNATTKKWDIGEIEEIENDAKKNREDAKRNSNLDITKDLREGITQLDKTGKITIWEFYGWEDVNGDGVKEKALITLAPHFNRTLRKVSLPSDSGKYPFVKLFYEITDDRWFSHRGIPELLEDVVKEIDMQHNQKLDQQTLRNSPMYVYRAGMINKNTIQFVFGQGIPAHGMQPLQDLIQPLNNNNPNVELSYEKEQMILESKAEELIGQIDFTLQSMINKRQPRTLGEVQLQQQNMQMVFSLDADIARMAFEQIFNLVWELWCQYGPDDYEFNYFGKEGWEPIKLTREEIQGKYKICVRGNDQNTNPQARIQKAQTILAMMQNPIALQMGVVTPLNLANAYKRAYMELDIPNWEELITPPKPQEPPPMDVRINAKDLTDAEMSQILAKRGIQPDVQGRALKSQAMIQEKDHEQQDHKMQMMKGVFDSLVKKEQVDNASQEEEDTDSE